MRYEFKYDGFVTGNRMEFIDHLMNLDEDGKKAVLIAFGDCIDGDCDEDDALNEIFEKVIRYGDKLYRVWVDYLLDDMEERVQYMFPDEGYVYRDITIKEVE